MLTIQRLTGENTEILTRLAREISEFDLEGHADARLEPLDEDEAQATLTDSGVLFWVAEEGGRVDGFLLCHVLHMWHAPAREVMLYEIGVRQSARRRGIGRALLAEMETWMLENGIADVWVPADNPGAEAFYHACGFVRDDEQAVMMSKVVKGRIDQEQE